MSDDQDKNSSAHLSIGALAKATGIPADTIRTWERRYDYPRPERSSGGHRLYTMDTVERLELIQRALEQGHRPGQVLGASRQEIEALLSQSLSSSAERPQAQQMPFPPPARIMPRSPAATTRPDAQELVPYVARQQTMALATLVDDEPSAHILAPPPQQIAWWLEMARRRDMAGLDLSFQRAWYTFGSLVFLDQYAAPLVVEIGDAWADGRLTTGEEHLISERLRDFLATQWRPMSDRAKGAQVICANLPGEQHNLGLHMVATVMALHGHRVLFLGANTPVEALVEMGRAPVRAILLSISLASDPLRTREQILTLCEALPENVHLVIGGGGASHHPPAKVTVMDSLLVLNQWAPYLHHEFEAEEL